MKLTSYATGTPCWVDLGTPDVEAARAFYGGLLGWTGEPGPDDTGGYVLAEKDGDPVAGIGPLMSPEQPTVWTTYFATPDVAATAEKVERTGGTVIAPPMKVMELGSMAIFADPAGASFGVWEKGTFGGAARVNEPGSVCWNELMTRDADTAEDFYRDTLGVGVKKSEVVDDVGYTELTVDDRTVAGMMPMNGPQWPKDIPPHWMVYFAVDDVDTAASAAGKLGGSVSVPPTDISIGKFAVVSDPAGATFSLFEGRD